MGLPKVATPKYSLNLPSNNKKISYRPFLVKEEKVMMMAAESGNEKDIMNAVKNVISDCIDTKLDVDDLPMFDIEYLFLNLRTKSVGESATIKIACSDSECGFNNEVDVNLSEIDVVKSDKHAEKVKIDDEIGIVLKYPTMANIAGVDVEKDPFKVITACIDYIYDSKQQYKASEYKEDELTEFIESLSQEQFKSIQTFFETMPKIKKDVEFKCVKCGKDNKTVVDKVQDFFT
jgi:hypothetical protein